MAILDKTIAELLKSIGIKLKPGLTTEVKRLPDIKTSFNLDFTKFGEKADPNKMKKLIETDANFIYKANEAEREQFVNNVNYLKSEYPDLFKQSEPIVSSKTGLKYTIEKPLEDLSEIEMNLGVTTPEHRKLVKEYLDAKKEHLEAVEKAKKDFEKTYKTGEIPMTTESRWALEDQLKKKGLSDDQIYDIFSDVDSKAYYWNPITNRGAFRKVEPEEYYKSVQDVLKEKHGIEQDVDFYINFAKKLKEPEFASGGRVGYGLGGDVMKKAIKALERAKELKGKWSKALDEGDWMSASGYKREADRIEAGYFLNKDPKDVTFSDILDYHKAVTPDTPSRYAGVEGEHWVDRARNAYKQMKDRWAKEGEPVEQLKIQAKPSDRDYNFAIGGSVLTPKSIVSLFGKTVDKGISSMFKKKKR